MGSRQHQAKEKLQAVAAAEDIARKILLVQLELAFCIFPSHFRLWMVPGIKRNKYEDTEIRKKKGKDRIERDHENNRQQE